MTLASACPDVCRSRLRPGWPRALLPCRAPLQAVDAEAGQGLHRLGQPPAAALHARLPQASNRLHTCMQGEPGAPGLGQWKARTGAGWPWTGGVGRAGPACACACSRLPCSYSAHCSRWWGCWQGCHGGRGAGRPGRQAPAGTYAGAAGVLLQVGGAGACAGSGAQGTPPAAACHAMPSWWQHGHCWRLVASVHGCGALCVLPGAGRARICVRS
jgi:hypothetical protein